MTSSRISYHVHATFTPDRQRLKQHIAAIRPTFLLVSGSPVEFAKELQAVSPSTQMIWREGGDQYAYQQKTPAAWLDERSAQAPGMYLYTSDETPLDNNAIDWHVQLLELAATRGIQLCVMNFGAGQPQATDWAKVRPIIDLLNAHRDLFVMGVREYAAGIVTSGLVGGEPTLIQPEEWAQDVSKMEMYHMGRYRSLMHYCATQGIDTPRLVVTHTGFERMGDLEGWLNGLNKTPPFDNIRGWMSLELQWKDWFGDKFESTQHAYLAQMLWANDVIYAPFGAVEAQMVYSWGLAGSEEQTLDISQAFDFQKRLEAYANTQPDYQGYTGGKASSKLQAIPAADRLAIVTGFETALAAGFLDATTANTLQRWANILKSL